MALPRPATQVMACPDQQHRSWHCHDQQRGTRGGGSWCCHDQHSALLIGSCALGLGTGGQRERRLRSRVRRRRRQEPISSLVLSFALGASCKPLQAIVICVDSDESDDDGYDETDDDDMSQYQDMCDRFLWERLVVSRFLKGVGKGTSLTRSRPKGLVGLQSHAHLGAGHASSVG